jgi:hypothetical protein
LLDFKMGDWAGVDRLIIGVVEGGTEESLGKDEKAAARALRQEERAAAKAQRLEEKERLKAQRQEERAAARASRDAARAAARAAKGIGKAAAVVFEQSVRGGAAAVSGAVHIMHRSNSSPEALSTLPEHALASAASSPEPVPVLMGADDPSAHSSRAAVEASPVGASAWHKRVKSSTSLASSDGEAEIGTSVQSGTPDLVIGSPYRPNRIGMANGLQLRSPLSSQGKLLSSPVYTRLAGKVTHTPCSL